MTRSNRTTGWLFMTSFFFAAFSAACGSGGSSGTGGQSGLGGNSGKGGAGANVDGGLDLPDQPTDGNSPDVPSTGTTAVKLVVGPPSITLSEGSSVTGMLSVALDRPYSQPITVTIVSANANVATVIPETVTFPENSITPQIVQVLAPVDDDTVPNTTTLTVFSQETGSANVTVNVDDPDVQGLLASPPMLSMTEGRTETVGIRLSKRPASAVVVTLTSSDTTKLMLGTASLTFTAANYSVPQNVSLAAQQDDDAMAEHVTIKATATGNIKDLGVQVEIIDDDAVNLDISPSSLSLIERSGTPGTIKVALTRAPSTDTTVSVISSNTAKVTVTPALLTFTVANFATPQSVTVSPVDDDDARDDTAIVTFSSTGITSRDVMVMVDDPDSQSLKVVPATLNAVEGTSTTFTVALALKPDGDTTVNVFSQNPGKLQVVPPVLHFDATDFAVGKTVTVQALEDDDLTPDSVNITLIGSTAKNVTLPVQIADNDTQALILVPAGGGSSLVMQETRVGGQDSTSSLGIRLAYRPADLVTISFVNSSDKLGILPTSVTFVPSDFATPKFITLTAKHDIDMLDDMMIVTAASAGLPSATLPVTVLDVDVQNLDLSGAPATLALTEHLLPTPGFTMAPLNVRLNVQPPSNVVVNFTSNSPKVTVPASCTINGGAASGNAYLTGCTVQVAATPDDDGRDETATITITASVAGSPLTPRTVPVTVDDTDTQALVVSATSVGPITEGMTGTFTVGLKLNPVDPVNVGLFASDPAHFSVSPPTLTFSGTATQTVTVTALNDDDMKSYASNVMVQGAAAGATPAVATVAVSETNTDVQAIVVTPGPTLTILEGSTTQLGVRMAYRPVTSESVTLTSADTTKLTTGAGLTFDSTDYATNKFVTLNALADANVGSHTVNVTAASSLAPATPNTVDMVTITDIDTLNFTVTATSLGAVTEQGATTTFTVGLTATPMAPVVVTATSSLPTSMTALFPSSSSTCTLASKSSTCVVTVAAINDLNALNENVTITLADLTPPAGGLMRPVAPVTVSATTADNDSQGLVVSAAGSTLTIHESASPNSTTFTVNLLAQPAASTTVSISVMPAASDGITVSPSTLTFTAGNYGTVQTVTVMGVADNDLRTDPFSIRITSPALSVPDQFVNVSEVDDDTQAIIISKSNGSGVCNGAVLPAGTFLPDVAEGGVVEFCVNLDKQPLSNTVVDATPSPSILTKITGQLSFSTGNYSTPQLVKLMVGSDADASPEAGEVDLSSSGFASTRSVQFNITDSTSNFLEFSNLSGTLVLPAPPTPGFAGSVSIAAGLTLGSMSANPIRVRLTADPVTTVVVTCSSSADPTVQIVGTAAGAYTFTGGGGSYNTFQTIPIKVDNGAASGTTSTITCQPSGGTPPLLPWTFTVTVP